MKINVIEKPSFWALDMVYQWKFPRLGWDDPKQELLGIKLQYHSRLDEEHYSQCSPCYADHLDFMDEQRADNIEENF